MFNWIAAAAVALLMGRLFGRPACYQMCGGPIEVVGGGGGWRFLGGDRRGLAPGQRQSCQGDQRQPRHHMPLKFAGRFSSRASTPSI